MKKQWSAPVRLQTSNQSNTCCNRLQQCFQAAFGNLLFILGRGADSYLTDIFALRAVLNFVWHPCFTDLGLLHSNDTQIVIRFPNDRQSHQHDNQVSARLPFTPPYLDVEVHIGTSAKVREVSASFQMSSFGIWKQFIHLFLCF